MYELLQGLRIVEHASFIAAPSCGLYLRQLGAEVIRIDPIQGGPDQGRWPLSPEGSSFYWEGLNKGKKSIAIDMSCHEGRELAAEIITASGKYGGVFVTNSPPDGFLSHAQLTARRADLISVRIMGWGSGLTAVDYTVNAALGLPYMTGPAETGSMPVNHVLPAWDLMAGMYAACALLVAERRRSSTGLGQEIRIPLGDIAASTLGNLGQVAEVTVGADRERIGNDLFGAFGRDFVMRDGSRIMLVAITQRQWTSLIAALDLKDRIAELEDELNVCFEKDEGLRFTHRNRLFPIVEAAVREGEVEDILSSLAEHNVCWSHYRTLKQALTEDAVFSEGYGLFAPVAHPSGRCYPTPGAPGTVSDTARQMPSCAPRLGEHTDEILAGVIGLSDFQIGRLHDMKIVVGPVS